MPTVNELFQLRSYALVFDNPEAKLIVDRVNAVLLRRAIQEPASGLKILIQSNDPEGYKVSGRTEERICVIETVSGRRATMRQDRVMRDWALTAYVAAREFIEPRARSVQPPRRTATPTDLANLAREATIIENEDVDGIFIPRGLPRNAAKHPPLRALKAL